MSKTYRTVPGAIEKHRGFRIMPYESGFIWKVYGAYLIDVAGDRHELDIEASSVDDAIVQAKREIDRR